MKKIIVISLILITTISVGGCSIINYIRQIEYIGFKEVWIKDYGTIKAPQDWVFKE